MTTSDPRRRPHLVLRPLPLVQSPGPLLAPRLHRPTEPSNRVPANVLSREDAPACILSIQQGSKRNVSKENLDEKIVKKKSIPAQIVFWILAIVLLYAFYKAFSGSPGH